MSSDWIVHSAESEGLCFPQRGAWTARALNALALQCSNSSIDRSHRSLPTKPQLELGGRIIQRLQEAGNPSPDLCGSDALSSLMGSKGLYNEEPQNLAPYDYDKVKVLKSQLQPRRLDSVLPDHAKMILRRHETLIQKPLSQVHQDGDCGITPYWDPKLRRSKQELVRLVVGLANQGLVTFRRAIREKIGLFFVKKKTPDWIRMVIDSRRVNELHQPPPRTRLSTPRSYLDIQFPPTDPNEGLAYGIEADVNDCFYNFYVEELASFFSIDFPMSVGDWVAAGWKQSSVFDEGSSQYVQRTTDTVVYPVFRGLCMGWAWSLYLANEAVCHIAGGYIPRPLNELRDKTPAPDIRDGPIVGVYVDNISIIGRTVEEVNVAASRVGHFFKQSNIPLTWTTEHPTDVFETVGIVLDFKRKVVRNKPKRLWKAFYAGREILRRKRIPTKALEVWLGHMTSLFMLTPHALSAFYHIYRYIDQFRDRRGVVWASVREEIRLGLGLMWMTSVNLSFDPIFQLDVGDSSGGAYALLTTWSSVNEIKEICRFREVWRFQPLPDAVVMAAETQSRQKVIEALEDLESVGDNNGRPIFTRPSGPFGAGLMTRYAQWLVEAVADSKSWLRTSSIKTQLRSRKRRMRLETDCPSMVIPVDPGLCNRDRFTLLWRKKWRNSSEHINVKEARVALSSF